MVLITPFPAPTNIPMGLCRLLKKPVNGSLNVGITKNYKKTFKYMKKTVFLLDSPTEGLTIITGSLPISSFISPSARALENV